MTVLAGIMITLCAAGLPQVKGEDSNTANEVVCELQYKTSGFNLRLTAKERPSARETKGPDFGNRMVSRGEIQGNSSFLFVWDKSQSNLYLDLNNNLDINEPNEVFSNKSHENMHVYRQFGNMSVPYILNALILSGRYYQFEVLSGFQGDVELGGKLWRVTLADNLDGVFGHGDYFAIISADSNFKVPTDGFDNFAPEEVFLDCRNWVVSYEFATKDEQTYVRARFKETSKPTGKLKIEGQFIHYLTLKKDKNSSMAVLERPEGEVVLPVGNYEIGQVYLDGGKAGLFELRDYPQGNLAIEENKSATLTIGGPLNNSVEVRRIGRVLQFNYKLKGIDGKIYKTIDTKDKKAPTFTIFRGDSEIGSGTFGFG
jgi:hypothetical protein